MSIGIKPHSSSYTNANLPYLVFLPSHFQWNHWALPAQRNESTVKWMTVMNLVASAATNLKGDGFPSEGFDKNLHSKNDTKQCIYIQSKKQALARVLLFSEWYLGIQLPRAGSEESRMRRFNVNTSEKAVVTSLIVITRSHV